MFYMICMDLKIKIRTNKIVNAKDKDTVKKSQEIKKTYLNKKKEHACSYWGFIDMFLDILQKYGRKKYTKKISF